MLRNSGEIVVKDGGKSLSGELREGGCGLVRLFGGVVSECMKG